VTTEVETPTQPPQTSSVKQGVQTATSKWKRAIAVDRIGGVYVWILLIVIFCIWVPNQFATVATAKNILNANAITGLAALALTIPLCARVFDLSFAYVMSLSGVIVAHLVAIERLPLGWSILIAVLASAGIGAVNGFVVVVMKIDSFIGTLATGALVEALITAITNDSAISSPRLGGGFSRVGGETWHGIGIAVLYFLVVAVAVWLVLEHTAAGRRLYATGFNLDASRLAGVDTGKLRFFALVACGTLSGAVGVVLASTIQTGSPDVGTSYLIPVFAAAFLGATQFKRGRFNAWGTVLAVLLLGTATEGLGLATSAAWAPNVLTGLILIVALAITGTQRRNLKSQARMVPANLRRIAGLIRRH
jgi:ribose transport system permease protein